MSRVKNNRDLKRVSLHVPERVYKSIKKISEEEDLSMAQLVRRAIDLYLYGQKELLGIDEEDLDMINYQSETRTKKALIISQSAVYQDNNKEDDDAFYEELNLQSGKYFV